MSQETHSTPHRTTSAQAAKRSGNGMAELISTIGYILAFSYPLLALSTGVRALYRLFLRDDIVNYWPPVMSAIAATCYLLATIGFAYRRKWSWWLSIGTLSIETFFTLVIGVWSYIDPTLIGRTVWRHFGADYGYLPFFQPILGLVWLLWPATLIAYGIRQSNSEESLIEQADAE